MPPNNTALIAIVTTAVAARLLTAYYGVRGDNGRDDGSANTRPVVDAHEEKAGVHQPNTGGWMADERVVEAAFV